MKFGLVGIIVSGLALTASAAPALESNSLEGRSIVCLATCTIYYKKCFWTVGTSKAACATWYNACVTKCAS
ncbi:hypothetical protein BJ166DRAFT_590151 [Pestalotiopsis sp. NC0098]|nr:hypothetical protein BJ166DRAFT_590151 [Pestalotiopsis sp. NC0098]